MLNQPVFLNTERLWASQTELGKSTVDYKNKLETYNKQITDKYRRLHNIPKVIETCKIQGDNINYRIKQIRDEIEELKKGRGIPITGMIPITIPTLMTR